MLETFAFVKYAEAFICFAVKTQETFLSESVFYFLSRNFYLSLFEVWVNHDPGCLC